MDVKEIKKGKNIELRSEEAQEVMSAVPRWILRSGISLIGVFLLLFFIGSYYFKYPDKLTAVMTLTTTSPPTEIIARATGRLDKVYVSNKQKVSANQILATIQSPANYEDIVFLDSLYYQWKMDKISINTLYFSLNSSYLLLGELQEVYAIFLVSLKDYINYDQESYYKNKMLLKNRRKKRQAIMSNRKNEELLINEKQIEVAKKLFNRDSILYEKNIETGENFDKSLQMYLQNRQNYLNSLTAKEQIELEEIQNQEDLLDLKHEHVLVHNQYVSTLGTAANNLEAKIKEWKQTYILSSPVKGIINIMSIWSNNQNVSGGDLVFIIIPENPNTPVGRAILPATGAGKIKEGQRVNVRVNNYPDQEFGFLRGRVKSISDIPDKDGNYYIEVEFPSGLTTNYGKVLPLSKQMIGSADIIIKDRRLLEYFIKPIEKLIREQE